MKPTLVTTTLLCIRFDDAAYSQDAATTHITICDHVAASPLDGLTEVREFHSKDHGHAAGVWAP